MGRKMEKSKNKLPLTVLIYFMVLFLVVLPMCLAVTSARRDRLTYRFKYDANPLLFETAYVTNRGSFYNGYESHRGFTLYEVILVCKNIGSFTADPQNMFTFYKEDASGKSSEAYSTYLNYNDNYDFSTEVEYATVIPAGQRGSYRCIFSVIDGTDRLVIHKKGETLDEKDHAEITIRLPLEEGGKASWEAAG